ncbi:hypothetical protein AB0L13_47330, partial [Saccharopolyspora shandongensis]|uniref:hypothetical protein n=1 Tax=Saccharopolyspora shandongensis TaxID=418495 RepID=UPI00341F8EC7
TLSPPHALPNPCGSAPPIAGLEMLHPRVETKREPGVRHAGVVPVSRETGTPHRSWNAELMASTWSSAWRFARHHFLLGAIAGWKVKIDRLRASG